jgi:hypothetical protein
VHWAAAAAIPQQGGLALIGDADRRDRAVRRCDRLAARRQYALPDLLRIVLDPARSRVDLAQLDPRGVVNAARRVEQDRAGAGGALVYRQNVIKQGYHCGFRLLTARAVCGAERAPHRFTGA